MHARHSTESHRDLPGLAAARVLLVAAAVALCVSREEFTRLAETRLAQDTLKK